MFHVVSVCGVCDKDIFGPDYEDRHWSEDGYTEYHADCCPECDYDRRLCFLGREELADCRITDEILNREEQ